MLKQCGSKVIWRKADTWIRSLPEEDDSGGELKKKTRICSDIGSRKVVGDFVCGCVSVEVERNKGKLCSGLQSQVKQRFAVHDQKARNVMDDQDHIKLPSWE